MIIHVILTVHSLTNQNYLPWPLNQSNFGANTGGQYQAREKPCTMRMRKRHKNLTAHQKEKEQSLHKIYWPAIKQHL